MPNDLACAVAAFLGCPSAERAEALRRFEESQWVQASYWLDTSGMALPLIFAIENLGAEEILPVRVRHRLQANLADNIARADSMFQEFTRLTGAFASTGASYAAQKGFSLFPDFCPEPRLRSQADFDFRIRRRDLLSFTQCLKSLGYQFTAEDPREVRFENRPGESATLDEMFKPTSRFRVELHFDESTAEDSDPLVLGRDYLRYTRSKTWQGLTFPALDDAEQLLDQMGHITMHLRGGWIRTAWLMEIMTFARTHAAEAAVWQAFDSRIAGDRKAATIVGLAAASAAETLQVSVPPPFADAVASLPSTVQLWIQMYGRRVALTAFPGSKLHIFLLEELRKLPGGTKMARPQVMPAAVPRLRISRTKRPLTHHFAVVRQHWQYLQVRGAYHFLQGLNYWSERRRWERSLTRLSNN